MSDQTYPTGWAVVAALLEALNVGTVFGLPSDDLGLLDAMAGGRTRMVLCRDQRNAVFMTTGHALASGGIGVAVVGKGPAVANAVTGLLEAKASGVAVLVLATGTSSARLGTGAFQELDQLALVRPVVKWAGRVEHADRLRPMLDRAVQTALSGAPGPVYLEIPEDIAGAAVTVDRPFTPTVRQYPAPDPIALASSATMVSDAKRPVLLIGGGTRHRNGGRAFERLAETVGAAVFATASGRGVFDESHPNFCGLAGLYTLPEYCALWHDADLIIALGSRLEETATFGWDSGPNATKVLQVNLAEADVITDRPGSWVLADAGHTVEAWLRHGVGDARGDHSGQASIASARSAAADYARARSRADDGDSPPRVAQVLAAIDNVVPPDRILVQENGLQDMWSYFYPCWTASVGGSIAPSEQTSLGFGMAAAVGAALACPHRPVVAFGGDGAFNLFHSDLATAADSGARLLMVVLNNGGYGWLQKQLDQRQTALPYRFVRPESTGLATAAGRVDVGYHQVLRASELLAALRAAWHRSAAGRVTIVEVAVRLDDVPPGLSSLDGDFPAVADSPVPAQAG